MLPRPVLKTFCEPDGVTSGSQLTHQMTPPSGSSSSLFFKVENRTTSHPVLIRRTGKKKVGAL